MKIAVPTRDQMVDNHFGHCDHYTIYTVEGDKVVSKESLPSPQGCGCKSNIAAVLHELGVSLMIAGSMGGGAKNKLNASGISVIRGCVGSTDANVKAFLSGMLRDSGEACASHDNEHECSHDHE